jgi:nucleoside-diphosphate-sugar epimerase
MVCEQWGQNHKVKFNGISRKGDPKSLVGDISLANELGFSPRISLQQGISEVVAWYKARKLT